MPPAKPRAYIETSVISYLAARPSRDVLTAAHQQITHDGWRQRERFDLFISEFVLIEARRGDQQAVQRRLDLLAPLPVLVADERVDALIERILEDGSVPRGNEADAAHIAVATVNSMQFLVTWNLKHMANAFMIARLRDSCESEGYATPTICTPEQFAESDSGDPTEPHTNA